MIIRVGSKAKCISRSEMTSTIGCQTYQDKEKSHQHDKMAKWRNKRTCGRNGHNPGQGMVGFSETGTQFPCSFFNGQDNFGRKAPPNAAV